MDRRHSAESELGDIGEIDVIALFKRYKHRWKCDKIPTDLGEDLIVRIYKNGASLGLSFYVQVKSTDNISQYRIKSGDISYSIRVKDLRHWEISSTPVFILVWDIVQKMGHWISVADAIAELDKNNNDWRKPKLEQQSEPTVQVHIPTKNATDDEGIGWLQISALRVCQHSVMHRYPKEFTLTIPATLEAQTDLNNFQRASATGEQVTLTKSRLQFSEPLASLLSPAKEWPQTITFYPAISDEIFPVKLEMVCNNGTTVVIPYLELRRVQSGQEQATFSNCWGETPSHPAHKATPFSFSLVVGRKKKDHIINYSLNNSEPTAQDAKKALPFIDALLCGGKFGLTFLKHDEGHGTYWLDAPKLKLSEDAPEDAEYSRVIKMLDAISRRVGCELKIPNWEIPWQDVEAAYRLIDIIATGRVFNKGGIGKINLNKAAFQAAPEMIDSFIDALQKAPFSTYIETGGDDVIIELLGVKIPLGPGIGKIWGTVAISPEEFRKAVLHGESDAPLEVELVDTLVIQEFWNWMGNIASSQSKE